MVDPYSVLHIPKGEALGAGQAANCREEGESRAERKVQRRDSE